LEALYRIDRNICVAWSEYFLDRTVSPPTPLIARGSPILWGRWHVFLKAPGRLIHMFQHQTMPQDENGVPEFLPLDMGVVDRILSDLGRHMNADEIWNFYQDSTLRDRMLKQERFKNLRLDELKANKSKIAEVLEGDNAELPANPNAMARDKKIYSYGGQGSSRGTSNNTIPTTIEERGWEKPDYAKEIG
jgi:hypothetical protein